MLEHDAWTYLDYSNFSLIDPFQNYVKIGIQFFSRLVNLIKTRKK